MDNENVHGTDDERSEQTAVTRRPKPDKDWGAIMTFGVMVLVVVCLFIAMVRDCSQATHDEVNGIKNDLLSVKEDIATIKGAVTGVDSVGNPLTVMDAVGGIRTEMAKSDQFDGLAKKADLNDLAKSSQFDGLAKKSDLDGLAKKSDLSGLATRRHLRRVERKLDAHIAAEEETSAPNLPPARIDIVDVVDE